VNTNTLKTNGRLKTKFHNKFIFLLCVSVTENRSRLIEMYICIGIL